MAKRDVKVSLVPHAVSSIRGALASVHGWLSTSVDEMELWKKTVEFYKGRKFIRIIRGGLHPLPDSKFVIGSNFADIGFAIESRLKRGDHVLCNRQPYERGFGSGSTSF